MATHLQLPQELIDTILENIDVDVDQWTLRCCSLASSSFLHSSRCRIFRRIILYPQGRHWHYTRCQQLHNLLLKSPHIATFIRELKLYEGQSAKRQDWMGSDPSLPSVLGMLKDLARLEFRRLEWGKLPLTVRQSIQNVLELPSLHFVHMERSFFASMDDFSSLLSHAEGLTGLSLDEIYTSWGKPVSPESSSRRRDTKEQGVYSDRCRYLLDLRLQQYNCQKFVNWILEPHSLLDVSHIQTLHIMDQSRSEELINRLLHAIGGSLKHFKLGAARNFWTGDNPPVGINVKRNPNIKSLHIANIQVHSPSTGTLKDGDVFELFKHFLSDVGESCQLEWIKLDLWISFRNEPVDLSLLEGVDSILAGTNFKSLGKVYIELFNSGSSYSNYPEMCKNVARSFPLLRAGGISVDVD